MKKSIAFLGALFMGSIAFAQVSKNENTNKTASRKVLDADVNNLPQDPEANVKTGEIKGESLEKHKGDESAAIQKGGTYKKSSMQKSSDASAGTGSIKGESAYEKQTKNIQKGNGAKSVTTQKEDFTIKSNGSGTQSTKSSEIYLKIGDIKGEK